MSSSCVRILSSLCKWPDLLPNVQSAQNNAINIQMALVSLLTTTTGLAPSPLIASFYRSTNQARMTFFDVQRERAMSLEKPTQWIRTLHPIIREPLLTNLEKGLFYSSYGSVPNFMEGVVFLVVRDAFHACKQPAAKEGPELADRGKHRAVSSTYVGENATRCSFLLCVFSPSTLFLSTPRAEAVCNDICRHLFGICAKSMIAFIYYDFYCYG